MGFGARSRSLTWRVLEADAADIAPVVVFTLLYSGKGVEIVVDRREARNESLKSWCRWQ